MAIGVPSAIYRVFRTLTVAFAQDLRKSPRNACAGVKET
jgi:hypothetical protein